MRPQEYYFILMHLKRDAVNVLKRSVASLNLITYISGIMLYTAQFLTTYVYVYDQYESISEK